MKKLTNLLCTAALLASGTAMAEQQAKNFEISLGGTVGTEASPDSDTNLGGMNGQIGFYLTKEFQINIRQYGYVFGPLFLAQSGIFADYHFDLGRFQPFVGVGSLFNYGENVTKTFDVGAEVGMKFFVLPKTFIVAQGSYMRQVDDFGNGNLAYTLYSVGIGFDF